ncbi:MAG: hypothetical protein K8R38_05135 [Verrucomicrobia bacterium]|nr:hypothetical protein [Verrucomicrobiota bacterium]
MLNESEGVTHLWRRLSEVTEKLGDDQFEAVFVDDGTSAIRPPSLQA